MTLTIKLDGNWSSFQLANSAPPLSVTDSAIAPSARMDQERGVWQGLAKLWESFPSAFLQCVGWGSPSCMELVCMEVVQLEHKAPQKL